MVNDGYLALFHLPVHKQLLVDLSLYIYIIHFVFIICSVRKFLQNRSSSLPADKEDSLSHMVDVLAFSCGTGSRECFIDTRFERDVVDVWSMDE